MYNFKKIISTAVGGFAIAVAVSTAASAATLSLFGTGTADTLPASFDLSGAAGGGTPMIGDAVTYYESIVDGGYIGGGLAVSETTNMRFTFLGKEAGATNSTVSLGGATLWNTGAVGSSFTVMMPGPGTVQFLFATIFGATETIANGGNSTLGTDPNKSLRIAFSGFFNSDRSVLAFFGDGRGDHDFDDMLIRIDVIPLPASALLLLGGMGGLGAMRLRKKS